MMVSGTRLAMEDEGRRRRQEFNNLICFLRTIFNIIVGIRLEKAEDLVRTASLYNDGGACTVSVHEEVYGHCSYHGNLALVT